MRQLPPVLAVLALACLATACPAQDDHPNTLSGPITAITSPTAFDVSGQHIALSPDAQLCTPPPHFGPDSDTPQQCRPRAGFTTADLFLGEHVQLFGDAHSAKHTFIAHKIATRRPPKNMTGTAIIDLIPAGQPTVPAVRLLRADGYLLRITSDSRLQFTAPLNSVADVSTNQWIQYSGTMQEDGTIRVTAAAIAPNTVSSEEDKLRKKSDYDPSQVPYSKSDHDLSRDYVPTYYKQIGAWPDAAMQARVQRIGKSLIPAYQRTLPDSDPTKINFRFAVIDVQSLPDALNYPSGVILLPHQLIERMQNDDQLATLLADHMAQILEKDDVRIHAGHDVVVAADIIGTATGIGAGIAADVVGNAIKDHISFGLARSGRVSLCLLHDAGYDIHQAPLAWWHLADKKGKPLDQIDLPARAEKLYESLALAWRNPVMNSAPSK